MWRRHRQEQGAVAIFLTLVTCFVMIPLAAFAVDIGAQRVARRDAQAIADTVALDMARSLSGGTTPTDALAKTSADRNKGTTGSAPTVHVFVGYIAANATFESDQALGCGSSSTHNGYFTAVPTGKTANAVLVTASGSVNFSLMGGSGGVCRSAIGKAQAIACFKLGSYAAAVHSGNSTVLGPLLSPLGSGIDTSVLSYQGLANTQLSLLGLATALGAGTPGQLLGTTVSMNNFDIAVVNALKAQGDTADANVLDALRIKLGAAAANTPVKVGDLLSLSQGDNSALGLSVNALDLIMGAATIADENHFISIPGFNVNLPGITSATTKLSVIEPPKPGCGVPGDSAAAADTGQVKLDVTASVLSSLPKVLGLGVTAGPIDVAVQAAQAHGQLTSVSCATPESMDVAVTPSLLPAVITIPITVSAGLLGSMNLTATVTTSPTNPAVTTVTVKYPDNLFSGVSTGSGNLNVASTSPVITPNGSTGLLGLVGITLANLTSGLTSSVVGPLLTTLVTPLLSSVSSLLETALGVSLAGADVFAESIDCTNPTLVG